GGHTNVSSNPPQVTEFRKIGAEDVFDGLSNTSMFMEKAVNAMHYNYNSSVWWHNWWDFGVFHNADWTTMRLVTLGRAGWWAGPEPVGLLNDSEPRPEGWFDPASGTTRELGFGSAHPGVTNAVLGDGSTRSVSNNADLVTLIRLGQRSDGKLFSFDEL
ncbi:MAG: DUF1559 domain-containing protein, partial [Planctomycetota bacterium]